MLGVYREWSDGISIAGMLDGKTTASSSEASHRPKSAVPPVRKAVILDTLPASDILQSLQKITNIVYLTKLDAGDKVKVRAYMTEAEGELTRLKNFVMNLGALFCSKKWPAIGGFHESGPSAVSHFSVAIRTLCYRAHGRSWP
jgi:hypothetical protein